MKTWLIGHYSYGRTSSLGVTLQAATQQDAVAQYIASKGLRPDPFNHGITARDVAVPAPRDWTH